MIRKRINVFIIVFFALLLIIIGYHLLDRFYFSRLGTVDKALECVSLYIDQVKTKQEYSEVYNTFLTELETGNIINYYYIDNPELTKLDSLIIFNKSFDKCVFFFLGGCGESINCQEGAQAYSGKKAQGRWSFREDFFTSFIPSKSKPVVSLEHMSKSCRLDIVMNGFIKNNNCEVNWDFIDNYLDN